MNIKPLSPVHSGIYEQNIKLACLRVGSAFYALDIMGIREIVRLQPIIPVPRAPNFIDGIIRLRKTVIPIVDLRRRFGIEPSNASQERIVICAVDARIIGLVVDEVTEVVSLPREEIQSAPYYMASPDAEFFPAVCRYKDKLLLLIDLRRILKSDQYIDAEKVQQLALEGVAKD